MKTISITFTYFLNRYQFPRATHPPQAKSKNQGIIQTQNPNLSYLLFIPQIGWEVPCISTLFQNKENMRLRTLAVRGCCGLRLESGDMQRLFSSLRNRYEVAAAVPQLVIILFLMLSKMAMPLSLNLCASYQPRILAKESKQQIR